MSLEKLCDQNDTSDDIEELNNPPINTLDDDCILTIFLHVPPIEVLKLAEVCTRWQELSLLSWNSIKYFYCNVPVDSVEKNRSNQQNIEKILSTWGSKFKHLELIKTCSPSVFKIILKNCPALEKLDLEFDDDDYTIELPESFTLKNLTSAKLKYSLGPYSSSTENFTFHFLEILPSSIKEINLSSSNKKSNLWWDRFAGILGRFNTLRKLTLNNYVLDNSFMTVLASKTTLTHLDLNRCVLPQGQWIEKLINLKHLNLSDTKENSIARILKKCLKLEHLNLSFCHNILDNDLKGLGNLKNLEHLDISELPNIEGNFMIHVAIHCSKLKHLDLSGSLSVAKDNLGELFKLKNLEYLKFEASDSNVDEFVIINIANNCRKLKCLGIFNDKRNKLCKKITKRAFTHLRLHLTNLEEFHVTNMNEVRDDLFNNMKSLKILNCAYCKNLSHKGVANVIKQCSELKILNVVGTNIEHKTLIRAVELTKNRTNNIILNLFVDSSLILNFDKSKYYIKNANEFKFISPFLVIK